MSKKAQKASPFGRGGIAQAMTERASPFPESRHAAISCLFGRAMLSLRLFLFVSVLALSGAPRQLSQRESHWQAGPLPTGRPRPDMTQKGGPCYRGQQLRDNIPCQAVVILDSGALPFSDRVALLVPRGPHRHASASPFGRGGIAQAMTERASPSPESRHAAISCLFGRAMLSLRLFLFVSILALSGAPRQLSQRESQKAFFLTGFLHSRRKQGDSRRFC